MAGRAGEVSSVFKEEEGFRCGHPRDLCLTLTPLSFFNFLLKYRRTSLTDIPLTCPKDF